MTSATSGLVHIARQAIYDRHGEVVGYELLFRGADDATEESRRRAYATTQVIVNAFAEFGLGQIVGDRPCFINLTREFLVGDLPLPFKPQQVVLEILETVEVDDEVVAGVAKLVERGFEIALDHFIWGRSGAERLLSLASYVKLDMLDNDPQTVVNTVFTVRRHKQLKLVAERIETPDMRALAEKFGFDLFQGYVYGRPEVVSAASLNPSKLRRLELFGALTKADIQMEQVVRIVTTDPALSYRVLAATNSAATGLPRKVASVREAIMMLGTERIRQWVALILISDISEATEEQLSTMMSRARLCQTLAHKVDADPEEAFTVGLLAGVAELVADPIEELVGRMPVTRPLKDALVHEAGPLGQVLSMVRAYDRADMAALEAGPVATTEVSRQYLSSLGWAQVTMNGAMAARRQPPPEALKRRG